MVRATVLHRPSSSYPLRGSTLHGSPRRSAKNALHYVTRTIAHSRALPHAPRLFRLSAWKRIDAATAPASWQAELLSVLWMAVRTKVITSEDSVTKLKAAASLGILTVPVRQLWRGALRRSIDSEISPYDILFIELAIRRKQKLGRHQ